MITQEHIRKFVEESHRIGNAALTICSSCNMSWRIGDEILISGTGSWLPNLRYDNVSICNLESGEILNGIKPSMESTFHMGVMKERQDINVVLHFQSPYATAVACMTARVKPIHKTKDFHSGENTPNTHTAHDN